MTADVRRRVMVHGRVQGVAFRYSVREVAEVHGVNGWVRNRPEGTVEAVFEGAPEAVAECVAFCRLGPPNAHVTRVDVDDEPAPEGLVGFRFTT